jgi:hypothetical protein
VIPGILFHKFGMLNFTCSWGTLCSGDENNFVVAFEDGECSATYADVPDGGWTTRNLPATDLDYRERSEGDLVASAV